METLPPPHRLPSTPSVQGRNYGQPFHLTIQAFEVRMYGTVVALLGNHACKKSKQVTSQEWDGLRAYECGPQTGGLKGQLEALRSGPMEEGRKATKNNFLSKIQQCSGTAFPWIRGLNQLPSEQGMLDDYNCSKRFGLLSTLNTWCPNKSKIENFLSDNRFII